MAINSRQKGAAFERSIAKILRERGFDARRGQQYSGLQGDADVIGLPGIHIEAKAVERLDLYGAYEQSMRDSREGEVPVVIHKKNRKQILITMSFSDFLDYYYENDC